MALVAIAFCANAASHGVTVSGKVGNYTYVDLGLPSGTKWATYNVGATSPTEYGDYFAWGEIETKIEYSWDTYKWTNDGGNSFAKYTEDGRTTLSPSDDVATTNWGEEWRMPTKEELQELIYGCDWKWTDDFNGNGVTGYIGTSKKNGNTIFLPAAGYHDDMNIGDASNTGHYWSSSLKDCGSNDACQLSIFKFLLGCNFISRYCGASVRAVVRDAHTVKIDTIKTDITKIDTIKETYSHDVIVSGQVGNYTYVDLGLPSGTKWATCNVGANKPTEYGDYFAWGETLPKVLYEMFNYKFSNDSCNTFTKYVMTSFYGEVDSLATLLAEDDAATANWGEEWRMPTKSELRELRAGCNWELTDDFNGSGVTGFLGTSKKNGHIIFLPAAGNCFGTDIFYAGRSGYYWSSSLY